MKVLIRAFYVVSLLIYLIYIHVQLFIFYSLFNHIIFLKSTHPSITICYIFLVN